MSIHLSKEIIRLKKLMSTLCSKVENSMTQSMLSVINEDRALASKIMTQDTEIDTMEIHLEEECLKILALYQPVAVDLRYVVACVKMNNDLERIGDLSAKIAKNVVAISEISEIKNFDTTHLREMMEYARQMVKESLDALFDMNKELAEKVKISDDKVDKLNKKIHIELNKKIRESPENTEYFIRLLGISSAIERIGDYATNIAEDIIYMITGDIVRHDTH